MAFAPKELDLAPGETYPVELYVPSPTRKAFSGALAYTASPGLTVTPDSRWNGKVPAWGLKTHPKVTAAGDAMGDLTVTAAVRKGASAKLVVRVVRPGVEVIPGDEKLTVRVTNPFRLRLLHGRVVASNPDRFLQDITTLEFKIAPGATQDLVFPLPGASPAEGEKYDFTLNVETYQGYRDRTTHSLAFPPRTDNAFTSQTLRPVKSIFEGSTVIPSASTARRTRWSRFRSARRVTVPPPPAPFALKPVMPAALAFS